MSDEEFIQFIPMIHSLISKYHYCNIDYEDLFQISSEAIIKGYKRFNSDKGMKLSTYLYSCVIWSINKELEKNKRIDNFLNVSLYTVVVDDITLEDTIQDEDVNVENHVIDKLIVEKYYKEISEKIKDNIKREALLLKVFENKSTKEISEILNINDDRKTYRLTIEARKILLHKSYFIKEQYRKYKIECAKSKMNIYTNPAEVVYKLEKISILKSHALWIK